jgi:hypothetical protein
VIEMDRDLFVNMSFYPLWFALVGVLLVAYPLAGALVLVIVAAGLIAARGHRASQGAGK